MCKSARRLRALRCDTVLTHARAREAHHHKYSLSVKNACAASGVTLCAARRIRSATGEARILGLRANLFICFFMCLKAGSIGWCSGSYGSRNSMIAPVLWIMSTNSQHMWMMQPSSVTTLRGNGYGCKIGTCQQAAQMLGYIPHRSHMHGKCDATHQSLFARAQKAGPVVAPSNHVEINEGVLTRKDAKCRV